MNNLPKGKLSLTTTVMSRRKHLAY